jgi:hypothetical protein
VRLRTSYKQSCRSFNSLNSIRLLFLVSIPVISVLFVGPYFAHGQLATAPMKIGVKITSLTANQIVPVGELTIYGTSSDTPATNCHVYVDWNDIKPMQNVTGIGSGGPNDYSSWTFTYTQNYHLITEGINELTSKISCNGNSGIGNTTTKYYSINITGSTNPTSFTIPTATDNPSDNSSSRTQSIGYHSIIPQYYNTFTNESHQVSNDNVRELRVPNSNTIIEIRSGYSDDNKAFGDNKKDDEKIEFHTMSSLISSKVENMKDGRNNLNIKWYKGEPTHQDLNKYIHNLIKEKLDRISERLSD